MPGPMQSSAELLTNESLLFRFQLDFHSIQVTHQAPALQVIHIEGMSRILLSRCKDQEECDLKFAQVWLVSNRQQYSLMILFQCFHILPILCVPFNFFTLHPSILVLHIIAIVCTLIRTICWSSRMTTLLLYHSIAPCTSKDGISASAICHLWRLFLVLIYRQA